MRLKTIALSLLLIAGTLCSCRQNHEENTNVTEDGAAKSEVTETGQHIGSDTDSTTVISDEPNPSND